MHYSGIVVRTRPGSTILCSSELATLEGLEVHHQYPESGHVIVVQETRSALEQEEALRRIQALPSVLTAALAEHVIDDQDSNGDIR